MWNCLTTPTLILFSSFSLRSLFGFPRKVVRPSKRTFAAMVDNKLDTDGADTPVATKQHRYNTRSSSSSQKRRTTLQATKTAREAQSSSDGVALAHGDVILPWIGYGTYKLDKANARKLTVQAIQQGYRCIDTAFIYGGETTETQVGLAIHDALQQGILPDRSDLVVQTKHWRKYHGYEPTLKCLDLSLERLQLDYIDVWLMHWPGPPYKTMNRRKDEMAKHGPWHYAAHSASEMTTLRSETWRAMESAVREGKVKAIGVSNFSIAHLERLKQTATIWPPAVNQIECHPLYRQTDLLDYCAKEGIVVQAYASLGGQDAGKSFWRKLYPHEKGQEHPVTKLWNTPPVVALAEKVKKTPAQVLLRWALEKNLTLVPKSSSLERMVENVNIFDFALTSDQIRNLEDQLQQAIVRAAAATETTESNSVSIDDMARLCWRNDPLRMLDFD